MLVSPDCNILWRFDDDSFATSVTYHDDFLYIMINQNSTPIYILDAGMLKIIAKIHVPVWWKPCYLDVASHKLYILIKNFIGCPLDLKVFVLDRHDENQERHQVRDIGNQAILHDKRGCFLVKVGSSTGLKRNSVYFPCVKLIKMGADGCWNKWKYCMTRFDMSDRSCEELNSRLNQFLHGFGFRLSEFAHSFLD